MARTMRRADRAWVALAAVTAARESCEVSQWLQEEAVDQGNMVCVSVADGIMVRGSVARFGAFGELLSQDGLDGNLGLDWG